MALPYLCQQLPLCSIAQILIVHALKNCGSMFYDKHLLRKEPKLFDIMQ